MTAQPNTLSPLPEDHQQAHGMCTFVVKDRDGKDHTYTCMAHPPKEAMNLAAQLYVLGGAPLGDLLIQVVSARAFFEEVLPTILENLDAGLMQVLQGNKDQFLGALREINPGRLAINAAQVLPHIDLNVWAPALLKHTVRDGKALSLEANYNEAYERNYFEQWAALQKVIAHNGFLPF